MATECSTKVLIEAPVEVVWNILTDVEAMPDWTDSMRSVRLVEGGELALGSKVEIRQPRMPAATWQVEEFVPRRQFRWVSVTTGVTTYGDHWIEPLSGGAGTEVRFEIRHTGALASIVGALTMRRTRTYVTMEAQGLKIRCEQSAAPRSSEPPAPI